MAGSTPMNRCKTSGMGTRAHSADDVRDVKQRVTRSASAKRVSKNDKSAAAAREEGHDHVGFYAAKFAMQASKGMRKSKLRTMNYLQAARTISRYGDAVAAAKEVLFYDPHVLSVVLTHFSEEGRWNISLASQYLPPIADNLSNGTCGPAALESLETICRHLLNSITTAARHSTYIGTDVAADERRKMANNCLKSLRKLRDNPTKECDQIPEEASHRLNHLLTLLKNI